MPPRQSDAGKTASYEGKIKGGSVEGDHQVVAGDGRFKVLQVDSVYKGLDGFSVIQPDNRNVRPI